MNKTQDTARAGMLAGLNAGHRQAETDRRLAVDADRGRAVALVPLDSIHKRKADSRPARAAHVLSLAESMAAVGLLQPLVLDRAGRLVAGLHRLEAVRLLFAENRLAAFHALPENKKITPEEAYARTKALPRVEELAEPLKGGKVPVRVLLDLDAEADPAAALAAEAAENTARREYTRPEVAALAETLKAAGYRDTAGRPKKGEKALRPALALVLGVNVSTVRRALGEKDAPGKPGHVATFSETLPKLAQAVAASMKAALGGVPKGKTPRRVLSLLVDMETALAEALAESKTKEAPK